ncbi:MAG TPA: glycine--tRNA ligase subunit beta [Stellaceae bacterium]|nr:glycine--tRNA ligase subunit beta [Stellaceae bacterium]
MGELLLELLSEEIPAGMQRRASDDLVRLVRDKLSAAEIAPDSIRGYVTPRRLTVIANGIPARQPARTEERRGPRVGAPQQALDGFLRSAGLQSIEQCEVRDTGRGQFYFAIAERPGRAAGEVLPELLDAAIGELPWPKSMRFPAAALRWVRPLTSVICLFDGEILPLDLGQVPVGRVTRGHRFLAAGDIPVENAADYVEKLKAAFVVLDQDRRRDLIRAGLAKFAAAEGLTVKPDPALLDEVTGLVEYPVVLIGRIDDEFVRPVPDGLPPEVLATAMRTHQKYFTCLKPDGSPAPRFLFVANNLTQDDGKTIVAGNERVLRARLADARFFWDQDRKVPLADRVEALKQRIYYDKLGTMFDKAERMGRLAGFLAEQLYPRDPELGCLAQRAARLAKADLSTGMVGEFPELQGAMGRYYALNDGEDAAVADAIAEHYKPLGPHDTCPTAPVSIIVALADKIDALAAFFSIGERPTGSGDPFALRRAALGVIRLIVENRLILSLGRAFSSDDQVFLERTDSAQRSVRETILPFIADRLKAHLREEGVRHDLIAAVFALGEDDLVRLLGRVRALQAFLDTEDGANLLTAYRRAANIVTIEERRDRCRYEPVRDHTPLRERAETTLDSQLAGLDGNLAPLLEAGIFDQAMAKLAALRRWVDEFFNEVTVNVGDRELRVARLRLLSRIRAVMNQVADFSQIEG